MKVQTIIAIIVALLFHICGAYGIMFTSYKQWFIDLTPLNLSLMFLLLLINQKKINVQFILFLCIAVLTGLMAEIIGVQTHFLFGNYAYGSVLGSKIMGVPFLIGVNWFVMVYCSCTITNYFHCWIEEKAKASNVTISSKTKSLSFIIDVALLTTCFDFIIEPVAIKLGFWTWQQNIIPWYNYFCWLMLSALLAFVFKRFKQIEHNYFSLHLFIIQLLFFAALRVYL